MHFLSPNQPVSGVPIFSSKKSKVKDTGHQKKSRNWVRIRVSIRFMQIFVGICGMEAWNNTGWSKAAIWVLSVSITSDRGGFRHVHHVWPNRGPTKRGPVQAREVITFCLKFHKFRQFCVCVVFFSGCPINWCEAKLGFQIAAAKNVYVGDEKCEDNFVHCVHCLYECTEIA